jgi:hypothetical protein
MKNTKRQNPGKIVLVLQGLVLLILLQTCDGCSDKPSEVNIDVGSNSGTAGSAVITLNELNRAVTGSDKEFITVSFSGILTTPEDGTGKTSFEKQRTFEVTSSSVNPVATIDRKNLKPGTWKVTVSTGTWSTNCSKKIAKDAATSFTFKYKKGGCQ